MKALNGEEITIFEGAGWDSHGGGPYIKSDGCPNCGDGAGWACDAPFDPPPCSRACQLQIEYAESLGSAA